MTPKHVELIYNRYLHAARVLDNLPPNSGDFSAFTRLWEFCYRRWMEVPGPMVARCWYGI